MERHVLSNQMIAENVGLHFNETHLLMSVDLSHRFCSTVLGSFTLLIINGLCRAKVSNNYIYDSFSREACGLRDNGNMLEIFTEKRNISIPFDEESWVPSSNDIRVYNYYNQLLNSDDHIFLGSEIVLRFPTTEYAKPRKCWLTVENSKPRILINEGHANELIEIKTYNNTIGGKHRTCYTGLLRFNYNLLGTEISQMKGSHEIYFGCIMERCIDLECQIADSLPTSPALTDEQFIIDLPKGKKTTANTCEKCKDTNCRDLHCKGLTQRLLASIWAFVGAPSIIILAFLCGISCSLAIICFCLFLHENQWKQDKDDNEAMIPNDDILSQSTFGGK